MLNINIRRGKIREILRSEIANNKANSPDMTAKEMQRLPKETSVTLKGIPLTKKAPRSEMHVNALRCLLCC